MYHKKFHFQRVRQLSYLTGQYIQEECCSRDAEQQKMVSRTVALLMELDACRDPLKPIYNAR